MIYFNRPLEPLLVALLHFLVDDGEAYDATRRPCEALVPGSYLAISHASFEGTSPESRAHEAFDRRMPTLRKMRSCRDIESFSDVVDRAGLSSSRFGAQRNRTTSSWSNRSGAPLSVPWAENASGG